MELVVLQIAEGSSRGCQRVVKLIIGVIHVINTEYGLQTAFIKRSVVGHKGQTFYQRLYLSPYFWKNWCIVSIFMTKTMHLATPVVIIVRLWLDKRVERIDYLTTTNNDNSNRAYATALIVCRFKIYCCKILHYTYFLFLLRLSLHGGR